MEGEMDIEKLPEKLQELEKTKREQELKLIEVNNKINAIEKLLNSIAEYKQGLDHGFLYTSSLEHFLNSDLVVMGQNLYCRQKVFVAAFNDHCRENHLVNFKWTEQFYRETFSNFGLYTVENTRKRYPNTVGNKSYTETFIIGLDIKNMDVEYESNESDAN